VSLASVKKNFSVKYNIGKVTINKLNQDEIKNRDVSENYHKQHTV